MNYQVLARKWRPRNFHEMVGQEHILQMLTHALDNLRLHHAYLFTGTRGVGKTTFGRILAKCLNCETGITSQPCNTCNACQAIDAGRFLDLIEIDAASRTKVEDTREILDNVQYAPSQGRFKIYLIDEVHMLSGHSFNALLKTLEEPPAHVKFILATTDPKRLPITILSRCLQFNLKRIPIEQIAKQLQTICTAEDIIYEEAALTQLAHAADGSMRDALSLLDQAIAYGRNHIKAEDTRKMLGNIEQDIIYRLLQTLVKTDGQQLLREINTLAEQAPDYQQVLSHIAATLHQIALVQTIAAHADTAEAIKQLATELSPEDVQLYYQIVLISRRDLALAPTPKTGFEMALLRMLAFKPAVITSTHTINAPTHTQVPQPKKIAPAPAVVQTKTVESNNWIELVNQLGLTGMALALASNCALVNHNDQNIELALSPKHAPMLNKKLSDRLEEALSQHFNKPIKLTIKTTTHDLTTLAIQQETHQKARHNSALDALSNDSHVQKIMNVFDATLDVNSVKSVE